MRLRRFADFFRRHLRRKPLQDLPVTADQKLGEVPGDRLVALFVGIARLEKLIDLACSVSIDLDLREHRKRDRVFRCRKLENFSVGSGFLSTELVARKCKNAETVRIFVKGTQTCVLAGEASTAGDVDD